MIFLPKNIGGMKKCLERGKKAEKDQHRRPGQDGVPIQLELEPILNSKSSWD
jgi:hypothetical protein